MTEPGSDLWTPVAPGSGGSARHGAAATRTVPGAAAAGAAAAGAAPAGAAPAGPALAGGSRRVPTAARPRRRWPWMVFMLIGVLALLLGVVRCSADSGPAVVPAPPAWSAPPPPAAPGSLTAGATSVFAAAAAGGQGLALLTGQTATGHAVPVESVPADEGFWIGTGGTDRVWVQLTTNDESAITITAGQLLDLAGPVVPHGPDFAGKAGVSVADGAEQLTRAGAHLEVDPNRITVVGTR
jgi:hypothetical protein